MKHNFWLETHKKAAIVIVNLTFTMYLCQYVWRLFLMLRKLDTTDKAAFIVAVGEFFVIILRIVLVWIFLYSLIERKIRNNRAKKDGVHSYLSEERDLWKDTLPGSRNGDIFLFSFFTFYKGFEFACIYGSSYYEDKIFLDLIVSGVSILPIRKNFLLIFLAILLILISGISSFSFYWDLGSGCNIFDKKNQMVYMTRQVWPGKGGFRFWRIPMKDILFVILKTDKLWGDVLYLKTGQQGTLLLTPINAMRYNLMEKGAELSRLLSVPLKIVQSNSEESNSEESNSEESNSEESK